MILAVCVDSDGGMLFNSRRQSKDRVLRERLLSRFSGRRFVMDSYSFSQFGETEREKAEIYVCDSPETEAQEDDLYFMERSGLPAAEKIDRAVIYCWNRKYPADVKFGLDMSGFELVSEESFAGSSHEEITERIYVKG